MNVVEYAVRSGLALTLVRARAGVGGGTVLVNGRLVEDFGATLEPGDGVGLPRASRHRFRVYDCHRAAPRNHQEREAADPATPPERMEDLVKGRHEVAQRVAANPSCPPGLLAVLARDYPVAVLANPALAFAGLEDPGLITPALVSALLAAGGFAPAWLVRLAEAVREELRDEALDQLAAHPALSAEGRRWAWEHERPETCFWACFNPSLTPPEVEEIATVNPGSRPWLAMGAPLTPGLVAWLLRQRDEGEDPREDVVFTTTSHSFSPFSQRRGEDVQRGLLSNPTVPPEVLGELRARPELRVPRYDLEEAAHPAASTARLLELARLADPAVARTARLALEERGEGWLAGP